MHRGLGLVALDPVVGGMKIRGVECDERRGGETGYQGRQTRHDAREGAVRQLDLCIVGIASIHPVDESLHVMREAELELFVFEVRIVCFGIFQSSVSA